MLAIGIILSLLSAHPKTCDPSAAPLGAWSGWGFSNSSLLPEERSDDCTPQAGVIVGHPAAQRRE